MARSIVSSLFNNKQKRYLRKHLLAVKKKWVDSFLSYDASELKLALGKMSVESTDTLLVHANFPSDSGFRGSLHDLVTALIEHVGKHGNLMMVSQPFRGYAYDYLAKGPRFDVRKTVSMMGLVTEMFRRESGTVRSLHPTHPVLVHGKDSAWITSGHEDCVFPCGMGSPFEKFRELNGKILFFDVSSGANTFFHHVEDLVKDRIEFPIYDDRLFSAEIVDAEGRSRHIETYCFARGVVRHTDMLERELASRNYLRRRRVGNSTLLLVNAEDVVTVMTEMVESGKSLIEPPVE